MSLPSPTRRRPAVRRRGVVYGYRTLRPEDGYASVELGYVGQTRQRLRSRDGQHREVQPWQDIIVGDPFVIAEGVWSDAELDAAEMAAIRGLRPRYNIACNEGNGGRIRPWVARRQRAGRDAARGVPAWQPPVRAAGWWPCRVWQLWLVAWLVGWPGWSWCLLGVGVPGWPAAGLGGVASAALLGWGVRRGRGRRRRRRRRR